MENDTNNGTLATDASGLHPNAEATATTATSTPSSNATSTDPNDKPADGASGQADGADAAFGADVEHEGLVGFVGSRVKAIDDDGAVVRAVVLPHDPLHELLHLIAEIRTNVPASVHHLVTRAEQLASELRAHL